MPATHSVKVGDSEHDKKSADRVVKAEGPAEPDGRELCDEQQRAHDGYGPPEEFRHRGCHGVVRRVYVGSGLPARSATMYAAYQSAQAASR